MLAIRFCQPSELARRERVSPPHKL